MHFEFDLKRHMNMQSIVAILRLNLEQLDNKHDVKSRKPAVDPSNARAWWDDLKAKNHSTHLFEQENGPHVVSWYSRWPKELLEGALDWCVDSTHHTYKPMTDPDQHCYLYTIVVRSPFTNKGVPVAFMLTSNEIIPNRVKWLIHLKQHNNLNVQRVVFGDTMDNILCYWHIKRAWDTHIKKELYKCQSFTNTDIVYSVVVSSSGYIVSCSCPVVTGIRKHMFLVSRIKVIPYYAYHSTLHYSSAPPPVSPSSSSPSASSAPPSTSTTFDNINTMDFDNKIAILERNFVKSVRDARKRVSGDDLLMDELCNKVKTALNVLDGIGNMTIYSARQL
ncbi:hypothetical protein [Absidia glauca]|uniref:Uncharacterized protein n=1 Tax=Absidia glauca TaxID=4829 RepID=A0A163KZ22_ABSGL|nr:hypothetical protein [Absidia glauca]